MGFFDFLREVIKRASDTAQKSMDNIEKYKIQYDRFDDERLIKEFNRTSGTARLACLQLLKERGYSFNS